MSVKFKSYFDKVEKEMYKYERKNRIKATKYLKKQLKKETASIFGAKSDLTKGVGSKHARYSSYVGFGYPAYHAHLIEFGTDKRFAKKGPGSGPKGTGHVKANPWVFRTFEANALAVMKILQEAWF